MPDILALIPARGGSKGVPRKNILNIAGKPLIAYSIQQALDSALISRVIVSTDDEEIAQISLHLGAEVPFLRPGKYAQDSSGDIDVFRHAISWLRSNEQYQPDLVVHLRPTGPVRQVLVIDKAISLLLDRPDVDALRSVSLASQTPYKMWSSTDDGLIRPLLTIKGVADCQSIGRQELPMVYWQNGYIDVIRPRALLRHNRMWGDRVMPYIINEPILEIDYPEDIPAVERALLHPQSGSSAFPVSSGLDEKHSV